MPDRLLDPVHQRCSFRALGLPAENAMGKVKGDLAEVKGRSSHEPVHAFPSKARVIHQEGWQRPETSVPKLDVGQLHGLDRESASEVGGVAESSDLWTETDATLKENEARGAGVDQKADGVSVADEFDGHERSAAAEGTDGRDEGQERSCGFERYFRCPAKASSDRA